jgi:hypothetical protein
MNAQQQYFKIGNQGDRLFLNKKLLLSLKGVDSLNIKPCLNLNTGHINFSMPLYNLFQKK